MHRRPPPARRRQRDTTASDDQHTSGLSTTATLTIALAGIAATLIAAIASSWLTGHQQAELQKRNLAAQLQTSDRAELLGVVDQAEGALTRADAALDQLPVAFDQLENGFQQLSDGEVDRREKQVTDLARRKVDAMRVPLTRLTVRLGAGHRITRAYRLASDAEMVRLSCRAYFEHSGQDGSPLARIAEQAKDEFNAGVTRLLGSALLAQPPRVHLDLGRLVRLEGTVAQARRVC